MDQVEILSNSKYPANNMRLIYAGKDLTEDRDKNKTLDDLSIEERATLFIVLRLEGGTK